MPRGVQAVSGTVGSVFDTLLPRFFTTAIPMTKESSQTTENSAPAMTRRARQFVLQLVNFRADQNPPDMLFALEMAALV